MMIINHEKNLKDEISKDIKNRNSDTYAFEEDAIHYLYQIDESYIILNEEDIMLINQLFNDVNEFYNLHEKIIKIVKENNVSKNLLYKFFYNIVKETYDWESTNLHEHEIYNENKIKISFSRFIFELPEIMKEISRKIKYSIFIHLNNINIYKKIIKNTSYKHQNKSDLPKYDDN